MLTLAAAINNLKVKRNEAPFTASLSRVYQVFDSTLPASTSIVFLKFLYHLSLSPRVSAEPN